MDATNTNSSREMRNESESSVRLTSSTLENLKHVKALEGYLDEVAGAHPIFSYSPLEATTAVLTLREYAYDEGGMLWQGSIEVLVPKLFKNCTGDLSGTPSPELGIDALQLYDTYYLIRELLYYTYNFPRSVLWSFPSKNRVKISIADRTIPLQIWHDYNQWFVSSRRELKDIDPEATYRLVQQVEKEHSPSKELDLALDGCMVEAKTKLDAYYNFLPDDLVFSEYSVLEFKAVYRLLTARSLLARYFAMRHRELSMGHGYSCLTLPRSQLEDALVYDASISREKVRAILRDLTYDKHKAELGFEVDMFPLLYDNKEKSFWLFPHMFCMSDCFQAIRRLWAKEDPDRYGRVVAKAVERGFTDRIERSFNASGFTNTKPRARVSDYTQGLPDVDLLVVTIEPGDMHVVLICELKNPLPELTAKAYVASAKEGGHIAKADAQVKRLQGLDFIKLRELLHRSFPKLEFGTGAYAISYLVVTSSNLGVLVTQGRNRIVDYQTLESALRVAKGDILVLLDLLDREKWEKEANKCFVVVQQNRRMGDVTIDLPLIGLKRLLSFERD